MNQDEVISTRPLRCCYCGLRWLMESNFRSIDPSVELKERGDKKYCKRCYKEQIMEPCPLPPDDAYRMDAWVTRRYLFKDFWCCICSPAGYTLKLSGCPNGIVESRAYLYKPSHRLYMSCWHVRSVEPDDDIKPQLCTGCNQKEV